MYVLIVGVLYLTGTLWRIYLFIF